MKISLIQKAEKTFGLQIETILANFVLESITKKTACERLNVTKNTLLKWISIYNIEWPIYTKERCDKWRQVTAERSVYTVTHNGIKKPLFKAAEEEGLALNLILERYKKGDRGKKLFRKARSYNRCDDYSELNLSAQDWQVACGLAKEIGARKAARKLDIPMSAVSHALRVELTSSL